MIQLEITEEIKNQFKENNAIEAAVLYGSFANQRAIVNSDIDLAVLVNENFNSDKIVQELKTVLNKYGILTVLNVPLRNKIVVYFNDVPKVEIAVIKNLSDLKRNYIGSLIPEKLISKSILFDKTSEVKPTINKWYKSQTKIDKEKLTDDLISKFIYEFESSSNMHSRSDGYRSYFFYNIAFHCAVQLKYISEGKLDHYFLPKKMTVDVILNDEEKQKFYETSGTTYLRNMNTKKRLLLDLFYSALEKMDHDKLEEYKTILENIYNRDLIWNFRDIAMFNPNAVEGVIYRTSTLTAYQNEKILIPLLNKNNISTIIDLRAEHEIAKRPYNETFLKDFEYIKAPFDPWNQPEWFKKAEHYGTNEEIAYRFFVKACKNEVKTVFKAILNAKGAVAIHCLAGKDRTGFIIMLINMLTGADYETILNDYMASELDTTERKFRIYYTNIENEGGIYKYLNSCGLNNTELDAVKNRISRKVKVDTEIEVEKYQNSLI